MMGHTRKRVVKINTIDELKYYCEEKYPVGALMLTGEWGCGKTYLLNTELNDDLKNTHVFLRISLFGVGTIEDVKTEVRQKWLYAFTESKDSSGKMAARIKNVGGVVKKIAEKAKDFLPDTAKNIVGGVLSINILDFIKVDTEIGGKKVVLIFDDLERANISTTDLLGCINDYCENLGFSTIIVANEEKIQNEDVNKIGYDEIKEKIIQRSVHHIPDYHSITRSVIENMQFKSDSYKELLQRYTEDIVAIFSGSTIDGKSLDEFVELCNHGSNRHEIEEENKRLRELLKKRPHNIRSLKCALQDFGREYDLLIEYDIPDIQKWLFAFVAYVFACRAGLVKDDDRYGGLFWENNVSKLYPGYYKDKFISKGVKAWVKDGDWSESAIRADIVFAKERDAAISPEEKARTYRIFELEENDVVEGYPKFLQKAYNGNLELDDYVHLICNSSWARNYNIAIPVIDWDKILLGVKKKIDELLRSYSEPSHYRVVIGNENRNNFTDPEWLVYEAISQYREGDVQIFENNRNLYIQLIGEDPYKAYEVIRNKRLDSFTKEMAEATLDAFIEALNANKNDLVSHFKSNMNSMINSSDFNAELTEVGLVNLKQGLEKYLTQCNEEGKTIAACHTRYYLKTIEEFISELK